MTILSKETLEIYAAHLGKVRQTSATAELQYLQARLKDGEDIYGNTFISLSSRLDRVINSLRLVQLHDQEFVLTEVVGDPIVSYEQISILVNQACRQARQVSTTKISTRINTQNLSGPYQNALIDAGFEFVERRVEYRTPVDRLPEEKPSQIQWQPIDQMDRQEIVNILATAHEASPDALEESDASNLLNNLMPDTVSEGSTQLGYVGTLGSVPACILFVYIDKASGWCTVPFMGVVPDYRKRGIGSHTHRHAFSIMRKLGGKLYHDSTSESNIPMIRLFDKHQCIEHEIVEEWEKT